MNRVVRITSVILIIVGAALLALTIILRGTLNIGLPLVFLMLGAGFYLLVFVLIRTWRWGVFAFVPGSIMIALGIVFLLNVLTGDWNSWAYAWLLIVAGAGLGLVLANWQKQYRKEVTLTGWIMFLGGLTFFAVFGAITGGLFIQIAAPILLALGGVFLFWLRPEAIFPENFLRRPSNAEALAPAAKGPDQSSLPEPLSARELQVLRLIDQGLTNSEIAARMVVAESTVKTHINNIYGKLGVQTRTQAMVRARELKLLE